MIRKVLKIALLTVAMGTVAAPARAELYANPWAGVVFGNDYAVSGFHSIGISIGDAGGGFLGTETTLGFAPGFFGSDAKNYVLDFMGGLTLGPTFTTKSNLDVHPYAVGEFGLIRTSIEGDLPGLDLKRNDFGYALGGGLMLDLSDWLGVRGDDGFSGLNVDVRDLTFWRASVGITLH